ncbi:MAG: FMN-binding glutamate synthase family protein, partial [Leptospiraceae bacterium]|nr:FMN-binding glutamate synthase family protein [Leptospiraceae bacterium]
MAYRVSRAGRRMLNQFLRRGKETSLILPSYKPPLQVVLDILISGMLLAVPFIFLFLDYRIGAVVIGLVLGLWLIREFFSQDDHALVRIYGPVGRLRYLFEREFRDKYLQYFNETNTDGRPIPRIVRNYIYQKAHNLKSLASFGTELDPFDRNTTTAVRILHRNFPGTLGNTSYGFEIGARREGVRPFKVINTLNISAMSYGSINYRSAEAMSLGAKDVAYLNTGEGGYGPHGIAGGDNVFQIGTGKFGVGRVETGRDGSEIRVLDDQSLQSLVREHENIRMIQIKISQGGKPALGGHLPGGKVTKEIAAVRKVPEGKSVISPPQHVELQAASPRESISKLLDFIDRVRALTGLPVSIKFCVGHPSEVDLLVEAMQATGRGPDHIQLDGADGGTGAGENLFINYVGYGTAIETLAYLDARLKAASIRDEVHLSASGRIFTPAHAALAFACGADSIDTARGALLALGCIQSLKCHTNECPTGITTNSTWRTHGLVVPEKASRVHHYLRGFHEDMLRLAHITGHSDPRDIQTDDLRYIT